MVSGGLYDSRSHEKRSLSEKETDEVEWLRSTDEDSISEWNDPPVRGVVALAEPESCLDLSQRYPEFPAGPPGVS